MQSYFNFNNQLNACSWIIENLKDTFTKDLKHKDFTATGKKALIFITMLAMFSIITAILSFILCSVLC